MEDSVTPWLLSVSKISYALRGELEESRRALISSRVFVFFNIIVCPFLICFLS